MTKAASSNALRIKRLMTMSRNARVLTTRTDKRPEADQSKRNAKTPANVWTTEHSWSGGRLWSDTFVEQLKRKGRLIVFPVLDRPLTERFGDTVVPVYRMCGKGKMYVGCVMCLCECADGLVRTKSKKWKD
jgi:hypothetical protein